MEKAITIILLLMLMVSCSMTLENVLNKTINVKVTYAQQPAEWIAIDPLASLQVNGL